MAWTVDSAGTATRHRWHRQGSRPLRWSDQRFEAPWGDLRTCRSPRCSSLPFDLTSATKPTMESGGSYVCMYGWRMDGWMDVSSFMFIYSFNFIYIDLLFYLCMYLFILKSMKTKKTKKTLQLYMFNPLQASKSRSLSTSSPWIRIHDALAPWPRSASRHRHVHSHLLPWSRPEQRSWVRMAAKEWLKNGRAAWCNCCQTLVPCLEAGSMAHPHSRCHVRASKI